MISDLTAEQVREALDYDPDSGVFRWRHRAALRVQDNARFAGRVAGATDHQGYRMIRVNRRVYKAHRLAWLWVTGRWPEGEIDHRNGDTGDNRFINLREASIAQNQMNRRQNTLSKSGFKGVSWHARDRLWYARIKVGGSARHLGYFKSPEDAHAAYCKAARAAFGEFARGK